MYETIVGVSRGASRSSITGSLSVNADGASSNINAIAVSADGTTSSDSAKVFIDGATSISLKARASTSTGKPPMASVTVNAPASTDANSPDATGDNTASYDSLRGEPGKDVLMGENVGDGEDRLNGGRADDLLNGGSGNDHQFLVHPTFSRYSLLRGDLGNNTVSEGQGSYTFILAEGEGADTRKDFEVGIDFMVREDDRSIFSSFTSSFTFERSFTFKLHL